MNKTTSTLITLVVLLMCSFQAFAESGSERFSKAGYYDVSGSGRTTLSMNPAWRFHKGKLSQEASSLDFDDSKWDRVNLPDGIELLPVEASGGVNYQGEVWYRKHFNLGDEYKGKKLFLHFEGIMGKSKIWINGKLLKEHFGGYLPAIVDITSEISFDKENVIAVLADNSDDGSYPPGKPQKVLDFCYFGGIYRDVWLISHNNVYITDPNYVNITAGGGLFVAYSNVSEKEATVNLRLNIANESGKAFKGKVTYELLKEGTKKAENKVKLAIAAGVDITTNSTMKVMAPELWSPETPELYSMKVTVSDNRNRVVDSYIEKIGIRSIEMKGLDGFYLNGKPYHKLLGANRHQDFAVLGSALPNGLHYNDVQKLRNAGMNIVRASHYPEDPAFMDACDQLGMFVIVCTPGWQFWNKDPQFAERSYSDIRNMVRRDRNHPSVIFWEPILNETHYPEEYGIKASQTTHEEYPFPGCYTACDNRSNGAGKEHFDILYGSPKASMPDKTFFYREWGDDVDDWQAHNSPSRVARKWGEYPMLRQADNYAWHPAGNNSIDLIFSLPRQHFGGTLWHSFDHQRGYHPDPFYGGVMDSYRRPKYSYYLFMSQRDPKVISDKFESGPMVYIANIFSPFSPSDVTVYSNCDQVRLIYNEKDTLMYNRDKNIKGMDYPIIRFPNVFHFNDYKILHRARKQKQAYVKAEGIIDGKVVTTHVVSAADRATKLVLEVDNMGTPLIADGSDVQVVVAKMVDKDGYTKRLNNSKVIFSIEGEGRLLCPPPYDNIANIEWGEAETLVQSTNTSGKITIRARLLNEGINTPEEAVLTFESVPTSDKQIFEINDLPKKNRSISISNGSKPGNGASSAELEEVGKQQTDFEQK